MKIFVLILLATACPSVFFAQSNIAMENLIHQYDLTQVRERPTIDPRNQNPPPFELEIAISHRTNLKELAKIQKQVVKKLRITLVYQNVQFDSTGLVSVTIYARARDKIFPAATLDISPGQDLGIYALKGHPYRCFFIGKKNNWLSKFNDLVVSN